MSSTTEPLWVRLALITVAVTFLTLFLLSPLAIIFVCAFSDGVAAYWDALVEPGTRAAIFLTLFVVAIVVPLNVLFGLAAAWCIGKFQFYGKSVLVTIIDLPFAVSPVIAGMLFIFLFGAQNAFGRWFIAHDIKILFATPAIVLATLFVTCPFVVRELLPILQAQGNEEEMAARVLGARGWQIFWRVTLPNIKWGLLYGTILCNARAMGEFGAVAVVSGRIQGETNTLPLQIQVLYNEYVVSAPFAVASLLVFLALITLVVKVIVEHKVREEC
ncbi:MAG: sulfate ABC transporter permease subunit CysW [Thermoguttaceae bacterium]